MPMGRTRVDLPSMVTLIVSPSATEVTGKGPSALVGRVAVLPSASVVVGFGPLPSREHPASEMETRAVVVVVRQADRFRVVIGSGFQSQQSGQIWSPS